MDVDQALEFIDSSIDHCSFRPLSKMEIIWEPGKIIANLLSDQKKETKLFTQFTERESADFIIAEDFLAGADSWFYVFVTTDLYQVCSLVEWVEDSSYLIIKTVKNGDEGLLYIVALPLKFLIKYAK
jgi:hypothetical protein